MADIDVDKSEWVAPVKGRRYQFRIPTTGSVAYWSGVAIHYEPDKERWWFRLTEPTDHDPGLSCWFSTEDLAAHVVLERVIEVADVVSISEFIRRTKGTS